MEWTQEQIAELQYAGRHHAQPGVRVKALAVRAVALGQPQAIVAELYATSRQSVGQWVARYRQGGLVALQVARGRGRKRSADDQELERYARQSPRQFGIDRSRWTLEMLAETVPSLAGFSASGVRKALRRLGLSYKRGQAWLTSPDPEYEKKRP